MDYAPQFINNVYEDYGSAMKVKLVYCLGSTLALIYTSNTPSHIISKIISKFREYRDKALNHAE
jgi:hypothetical protein